ncbi:MAG: hypothetical protein OIF57_07545, partial [Marinobacterium sp.]|nr:hypothetical protein [Marinobacterium sp.]
EKSTRIVSFIEQQIFNRDPLYSYKFFLNNPIFIEIRRNQMVRRVFVDLQALVSVHTSYGEPCWSRGLIANSISDELRKIMLVFYLFDLEIKRKKGSGEHMCEDFWEQDRFFMPERFLVKEIFQDLTEAFYKETGGVDNRNFMEFMNRSLNSNLLEHKFFVQSDLEALRRVCRSKVILHRRTMKA